MVIGPALPPGFKRPSSTSSTSSSSSAVAGPARPVTGPNPENNEDEEDGDPFLPQKVFDERAERERLAEALREREREAASKRREDWMTSLPEKKGPVGVGPRTFRADVAEEADQSWTLNPAQQQQQQLQQQQPQPRKPAGPAAAPVTASQPAKKSLMDMVAEDPTLQRKTKKAKYDLEDDSGAKRLPGLEPEGVPAGPQQMREKDKKDFLDSMRKGPDTLANRFAK